MSHVNNIFPLITKQGVHFKINFEQLCSQWYTIYTDSITKKDGVLEILSKFESYQCFNNFY